MSVDTHRHGLIKLLRRRSKTLVLKVLGIDTKPKPYLYDISRLERIVEYGWVLRNLGDDVNTILDVGCAGTLFPIQLASLGYKVVGIDLRDYPYTHPNFRFVKGDVFDIDKLLPEEQFDAVTLISTLEHIGILYRTEDTIDLDADVKTIRILSRKLTERGKILITIPVGKFKILKRCRLPEEEFPEPVIPWLKVYDREHINRLATGTLTIEKIDYFINENGYWRPAHEEEAMKYDYPEVGAKIKSIACLILRKSM